MSDAAPTNDAGRQTRTSPKRRGKVRKRHTVGRVLLASVLVLALATGLVGRCTSTATSTATSTSSTSPTSSTDRPDKKEVSGPQEPLNVLVMGSDNRDGEGNNIDSLTGGGQRSDTTILLHLSADRKRAYGVSIPRDSIVDRPDCIDEDGDTDPRRRPTRCGTRRSPSAARRARSSQFEQLTGIRDRPLRRASTSTASATWSTRSAASRSASPSRHRGPGPRHQHRGRHPQDQGHEALNYVRERYVARQRLRHRPDEAPAGVHRRDGPQGVSRRHAGPPRPPGRLPQRRHQVAHRSTRASATR